MFVGNHSKQIKRKKVVCASEQTICMCLNKFVGQMLWLFFVLQMKHNAFSADVARLAHYTWTCSFALFVVARSFVQGEVCVTSLLFFPTHCSKTNIKQRAYVHRITCWWGKKELHSCIYIFSFCRICSQTKFQCHNTFAYRCNRSWYEMYNCVNINEVKKRP